MKDTNYFRFSRPMSLVSKVRLVSMMLLTVLFMFSSDAFAQTVRSGNLGSPYPSLKSAPNAKTAVKAYMTVLQAPYIATGLYDAVNDPDKILDKAKILESVYVSLEKGNSVTDALNNAFLTKVYPALSEQERFDKLYNKDWTLQFIEVVNLVKL